MRNFRSNKGPFAERPYFTAQDVDAICTDELQKVGLYPDSPSPVRIERFIEKRFRVQPVYDDLPSGVLGYTEFGPSGVVGIRISRALAEEGGKVAERRISTTFAHEAGHGLLHAHVFALERHELTDLFGDGVDRRTPKVLCRDGDVGRRQTATPRKYDGRWWEYQANMAIGALLLPRALVSSALEPYLEERGSMGKIALVSSRKSEAVRALVDVFDVNPAVAEIRLDEICPGGDEDQLTL